MSDRDDRWDVTRNPMEPNMAAVFSHDRQYRYALFREWEPAKPAIMWIGLNPSTADAFTDDPTIRRIIGFSRRWGYGRLYMANLFAFRATDPKDMKAESDPVGPHNDLWLGRLWGSSRKAVAAWGVHGEFKGRDAVVKAMFSDLSCLGFTKGGFPKHPLYVKADTALEKLA